MTEKKELKFSLSDIKEKPSRGYKKGSKYDALLNTFNESKSKLVKVDITGVKSNYIRTQLDKRIKALKMSLAVSVVNDVCYLEKILTVQLKP